MIVHRSTMLLALIAIAVAVAALPLRAQNVGADPLRNEQWALDLIGAPCVWANLPPRQNVVVAVVDSGVDDTHPDLAGIVRADGYDFVDNDSDPRDENGHGTHVAGIIAAQLNNAEGGAGLAPNVQILPVRVVGAEGVGSDQVIAQGIDFAVERGARVINLSIGSTLLLATPESSRAISAAIARAIAADVVVVAAAGNDFLPLPNAIIGANEAVLVVAATTRDDQRARFSNSGPWVDVSAPGERILSTMPTYEVYLTSAALPPEQRFDPFYDTMSGTSQAAPFVSALAALLIARDPSLSTAQVQALIEERSVDIYANLPSYYGRLRLLGAGRIDACAALTGEVRSAQRDLRIPFALAGSILLLTLVGITAGFRLRQRRPRLPMLPTFSDAFQPARLGDTLAGMAAAPIWARLRNLADEQIILLRDEQILIGSDPRCDVPLPHPTIAPIQARIVRVSGVIWLEDVGNGTTRLNRRILKHPKPLQAGDLISLGNTTFRFEPRREQR